MTKRRFASHLTRLPVLLSAIFATAAGAAQFSVDDTADAVDASPGDGVCATWSGACTLRAAIQESNALPGADRVVVPAGRYPLSLPGASEDLGATGDWDLLHGLELVGAGPGSSVLDGDGLDRLIHVHPGAEVTISGFTITGGAPPLANEQGGGVANYGDLTLDGCEVRDNTAWLSGGVVNLGTLRVLRSSVTGNQAMTLGNVLGGGGIGNAGTLFIEDSTIRGNSALGTGGGVGSAGPVSITRSTVAANHADGNGGGIASVSGVLSISNSTISGNTTNEGGGGITVAGELVLLDNVTLTDNVADVDGDGAGDGGGIRVAGVVSLANSIVAGNVDSGGEAADCTGGLVSRGHNLIGDVASCQIAGDSTGNLTDVDPELGPLADHGGPTETHAPLTGSPVIDAGSAAAPGLPGACQASDQRLVARPLDGDADGEARCDVGAVEVEAPVASRKANGGGWLATLDGRKLNFGFNARQEFGDPEGQLQLHDKAAGVKIHISELLSLGDVSAECGSVEPGAEALELRGLGRINGADGAEFRVCVEDQPDLFYLECLSGCVYDTASRVPDDALDGGNIQVRGGSQPPPEESGEASVLVLDPVILGEAPAGGPQLLTVTAYGSDADPLPGTSVALEAVDPTGQVLEAEAVTGPLGTALFTLDVVEGESECMASSAGRESNVLELTGTPP